MAYELGDLVVLVSGSMRMAVESTDGDKVAVVWCNEGVIGRDSFDAKLLKKWEMREDHGAPRGGKPFRSDREGGGKPFRGGGDRGPDRGGERGGDRGDSKPRGKTGWDGKPREKKFFRKDD
ncbi:hypothetical protein [Pikeienuella sp. HZG-20]|uniref:hypothetical protein n=1 Tax=Paludibacillus litoralis TaxID=3133267 RepID=UPI0030EB4642